jgi:hypothetical protein
VIRAEGIAIATPTLVRDAGEGPLLRSALASLAALDLPLFVCDGGSGGDFLGYLRTLSRTTLVPPSGTGLVAQVKGSLRAAQATGARFVLYTEPDKRAFFEQKLGTFLGRAPLDDNVGVVIAGRSSSSFATYPRTQRFAEETINRLTGEHCGVDGDYSYGPLLLHHSIVPFIDAAGAELGWGWRHFIFAVTHRLGRKVVHIEDDLPCPDDQRVDDERERLHRLRQLGQNVNGLLAGVTFDLPTSAR